MTDASPSRSAVTATSTAPVVRTRLDADPSVTTVQNPATKAKSSSVLNRAAAFR